MCNLRNEPMNINIYITKDKLKIDLTHSFIIYKRSYIKDVVLIITITLLSFFGVRS